jgi:hypothetical protein
MTPGLLRSTNPTSARTRRGRRTQSSFPTPRRRSRRSWAGRMPRASPSSAPNDSRAAEGQQTLEIGSTQSCTIQMSKARRGACIERLRVDRRQSSLRWNMPVTPEVAGSSPVAPVKLLQIGSFCCPRRRKRPPPSRYPALIPPADTRLEPLEAGNTRNRLAGRDDRRSKLVSRCTSDTARPACTCRRIDGPRSPPSANESPPAGRRAMIGVRVRSTATSGLPWL